MAWYEMFILMHNPYWVVNYICMTLVFLDCMTSQIWKFLLAQFQFSSICSELLVRAIDFKWLKVLLYYSSKLITTWNTATRRKIFFGYLFSKSFDRLVLQFCCCCFLHFCFVQIYVRLSVLHEHQWHYYHFNKWYGFFLSHHDQLAVDIWPQCWLKVKVKVSV